MSTCSGYGERAGRHGGHGLTNFWFHRPVLVTGCNGFLGSWLTEELATSGAEVVGLVRDWTPRSRLFTEGIHERITIVRGAVDDLASMERILNEYEIDTVFHLAAQTIVPIANRSPISTFESNIRGTWNVLEACRQISTVKRIVVASSDKAYGQQQKLPYTEETPLQGRYPYDVSKSCADLIAQSYHATYRTPVCITRCGNLYGGGDLNFNRIVPGTIRSLHYGQRPVIRSDGSYVRDYFYVRDAALAYLSLAEWMDDGKELGRSFNFSYERGLTALEMVHHIIRLMKRKDLEPIIMNEVRNEIPRQELSAQAARKALGWTPKYDLEAGLSETINWYRSYLETYDRQVQKP